MTWWKRTTPVLPDGLNDLSALIPPNHPRWKEVYIDGVGFDFSLITRDSPMRVVRFLEPGFHVLQGDDGQ